MILEIEARNVGKNSLNYKNINNLKEKLKAMKEKQLRTEIYRIAVSKLMKSVIDLRWRRL